jgi:MFS family permease
VLTTIASLVLIFVIREKPKHPPSKVALVQHGEEGVCKTYKELFKMRNYMILVFVFTILFATYIALATIIDPLLLPYGYAPGLIALMGVFFIIAGVVSTMIIGCLLDKTKKYLLTLRLVTFLSFLAASFAYFVFPMSNAGLCIGVILVIGFCLVPIMAVGFSFATELTHPIPPVFSNGLMLMFSNVFAWPLSFLLLYIMAVDTNEVQGSQNAVLIVSAILLLASVATIFIKEDLRRLKAEKEGKEKGINVTDDTRASAK